MSSRSWASASLAAVALIVAACGSSSAPSTSGSGNNSTGTGSTGSSVAAAHTAVSSASMGGATVLTNSKGYTLYTFALDTPGKSNCDATCQHYWPPVKGPVTAGSGVTGTFSTIKDSDGTVQATYDGHPLYTYIGDTPGQEKGNGLKLSGGVWNAITVSGAAAPLPAASPSSSSNGGYGY